MNDIKPFDEMTVAELTAYLTERGKAGDGDAMKGWNTKTRKADLLTLVKAAHRRMIDGDETEQEIEAARNDDARVADMMTPGIYHGRVAAVDFKTTQDKINRLMLTIDSFAGQFVMYQNMWTHVSLVPTRKHKLNKRGKRHASFKGRK